jgi:hypothetical protein
VQERPYGACWMPHACQLSPLHTQAASDPLMIMHGLLHAVLCCAADQYACPRVSLPHTPASRGWHCQVSGQAAAAPRSCRQQCCSTHGSCNRQGGTHHRQAQHKQRCCNVRDHPGAMPLHHYCMPASTHKDTSTGTRTFTLNLSARTQRNIHTYTLTDMSSHERCFIIGSPTSHCVLSVHASGPCQMTCWQIAGHRHLHTCMP